MPIVQKYQQLNAFETTNFLQILFKSIKGLENYEEREDNPPSTNMHIMA